MADEKEGTTETKKKVVKEDIFTIEEFCSLKDLNKYYLDSFKMIFGNMDKKTISEWTKILVKKQLIKEEQIK